MSGPLITAHHLPPRVGQGLLAVILAGGQSRRMFAGGVGSSAGVADKTLLPLAGQPVLAHVVNRLRPQTDLIVLNANGDHDRFRAFGLETRGDEVPDMPGPMAGILIGLKYAGQRMPSATHILTVPCDGPFLPLDLLARLHAAAVHRDQIVLAESSSGQHYVTGLWPVSLADRLEQDIRLGHSKVSAWVKAQGAVYVTFPDHAFGGQTIDPFFNINTVDDFKIAEQWSARSSQRTAKLVGIAGWKNSGKTTLTAKLIAELKQRGLSVAAVKCSHHDFDAGVGDALRRRDTDVHRDAGTLAIGFMGRETFGVVTADGTGLLPSLKSGGDRMRDLVQLIEVLPDADIIVVEGFKAAPFAKIEVRSADAGAGPRLADSDGTVVAIATASQSSTEATRSPPEFSRDDITALADVVIGAVGL